MPRSDSLSGTRCSECGCVHEPGANTLCSVGREPQPPQILRCPSCGADDALWQGAVMPGWVALNADGTLDRKWEPGGFGHELDEHEFGCGNCSYESTRRADFENVHPDQEALNVAPH